eukprot:m.222364 g.222364  ORF g.222364 m.222364 type:complete len:80 (-) comp16011_c0_seq1:178-417(-)
METVSSPTPLMYAVLASTLVASAADEQTSRSLVLVAPLSAARRAARLHAQRLVSRHTMRRLNATKPTRGVSTLHKAATR